MADRPHLSASATACLTIDSHGRWSVRMNTRAPGRTWRGITEAWIETGRAPQIPQTHAEMEQFLLSVLLVRHPQEC